MNSSPWSDDPGFGQPPSLPEHDSEFRSPDRYNPQPFKPELNAKDRFVGAIAAILLAPLVVDVPMAAILRGRVGGRGEPEVLFMLVTFSITVAKFCLLAIWLAWGGSRLIWRVIVVFASLLFTCLAFAYDMHATEGYSLVLLACTTLAGAVASPKLFGIRWIDGISAGAASGGKPAHTVRQFTLVDMFIWTATVAVVSGVIRWLGVPRDLLHPDPLVLLPTVGCGLGYPAAGTLLAMWAALAPSPNVGPRCVAAWFVMIGLMSPFLLMIAAGARQEAGTALLVTVGAMSGTMFLMFAPLLVLRNWGHRLVRERRSTLAQAAYHG